MVEAGMCEHGPIKHVAQSHVNRNRENDDSIVDETETIWCLQYATILGEHRVIPF